MKNQKIYYVFFLTILLISNPYNGEGLSLSTEIVTISYENNLREHLIKKEKHRPKSSKYRDFPNIEELDDFMFDLDDDDEDDPSDFSKFV
jgi:hypothetical protein